MGLQICLLNLNQEQKELQPHGTLDFPCAGYLEHYTGAPESRIPWHWHDELEMIYILSGELTVKIPSETFELFEGDCVIINSGILHSAMTKSECELQSMVFHSRLITGNDESVYAKKYIFPLLACCYFRAYLFDREQDNLTIQNFKDAFDSLAADAPGFEFTVREKLSSVFLTLYCHFEQLMETDAMKLNHDDMRIRKMLDYIQGNYASDISLADIAKAADIGERECLRCFQKTIQYSPMQYLLKYRIMRGAEELLNQPAAGISDIAISCGFDSPSYFAKMFKRFYNCTPRDYRKGSNSMSSSISSLVVDQLETKRTTV